MLVSSTPDLAQPPPPPHPGLFPLVVKNLFQTKTMPLHPGPLSASRLFPTEGNFGVDSNGLLAPLFPDSPPPHL